MLWTLGYTYPFERVSIFYRYMLRSQRCWITCNAIFRFFPYFFFPWVNTYYLLLKLICLSQLYPIIFIVKKKWFDEFKTTQLLWLCTNKKVVILIQIIKTRYSKIIFHWIKWTTESKIFLNAFKEWYFSFYSVCM